MWPWIMVNIMLHFFLIVKQKISLSFNSRSVYPFTFKQMPKSCGMHIKIKPLWLTTATDPHNMANCTPASWEYLFQCWKLKVIFNRRLFYNYQIKQLVSRTLIQSRKLYIFMKTPSSIICAIVHSPEHPFHSYYSYGHSF